MDLGVGTDAVTNMIVRSGCFGLREEQAWEWMRRRAEPSLAASSMAEGELCRCGPFGWAVGSAGPHRGCLASLEAIHNPRWWVVGGSVPQRPHTDWLESKLARKQISMVSK